MENNEEKKQDEQRLTEKLEIEAKEEERDSLEEAEAGYGSSREEALKLLQPHSILFPLFSSERRWMMRNLIFIFLNYYYNCFRKIFWKTLVVYKSHVIIILCFLEVT